MHRVTVGDAFLPVCGVLGSCWRGRGVASRLVAVSGRAHEFRLPPLVDEPGVDWRRVTVYVMGLLVLIGFWGGVLWLILG